EPVLTMDDVWQGIAHGARYPQDMAEYVANCEILSGDKVKFRRRLTIGGGGAVHTGAGEAIDQDVILRPMLNVSREGALSPTALTSARLRQRQPHQARRPSLACRKEPKTLPTPSDPRSISPASTSSGLTAWRTGVRRPRKFVSSTVLWPRVRPRTASRPSGGGRRRASLSSGPSLRMEPRCIATAAIAAGRGALWANLALT
ncbi:DUF1857 family protein, partial [bacterium]|nr:DUF1857 family protein [bacterium]